MRQQEVEAMFRKYGHERGTVHVVMRLAEEQEFLKNTVREMAMAFEQVATVVTMGNTVMDAMKDKIDAFSRHFDTDPRSTHAMVRSTEPEDE